MTDGTGNHAGVCRDCGLPVWWDHERLVTRRGSHWCPGPDQSRPVGEAWHALPGMAQYISPSPEGQVCHCLARGTPHIHRIEDVTS